MSVINYRAILTTIVIAQFCCTSLWFAGNGVMPDLLISFQLEPTALGNLTSAVQLGFISGTLIFAILSIADRFSPSKVFFVCALVAATFNLGVIWEGNSSFSLLSFRFGTGFFLAGIYPVGMKIAADYFEKGLGKSLGFLVGALVLGTAFPHLLRQWTESIRWEVVLIITSGISVIGGILILAFVPNGPYRKASQKPDFSAFIKIFKKPDFRAAAFGYFGHMWELYAFWAFVPVMLTAYILLHPAVTINIGLWSFFIIGIGGISCVLGGYLSQKIGVKRSAAFFLTISGICCLISPLMMAWAPTSLFMTFLIIWGMVVIADSPLFSTLVAQNASSEVKGTALTIVNSIGFAITIVSIQLINMLQTAINPVFLYMVLAVGPILGLFGLYANNSKSI